MHVTPVLHRPTGVGRITALVVGEAARGHGVGRALVAEAERRLEVLGCALVEVTSNQKRTDAHDFYRRLGYEATSVRFARTLP
jgi:PhnO protein